MRIPEPKGVLILKTLDFTKRARMEHGLCLQGGKPPLSPLECYLLLLEELGNK
jgi:hypothetical protein